MKWLFSKDRRQEARRSRQRRATARGDSDRRGATRRLKQRRDHQRLSFPPGATLPIVASNPEYIAAHFRVLDLLSEKSIQLVCVGNCKECEMPVELGSTIEATIEFHDENRVNTKGRLIRYSCDLESKNKTIVSVLENELPLKVINEEQKYLLRRYPDYLAGAKENEIAKHNASAKAVVGVKES